MAKFTRRQWLTLIVISVVDFCNGICVSLQAPFYPQEAEKKGCTASEYGIVFGIFELIVFFVSPFLGARVHQYGTKTMFNWGIFTTSICVIVFGLLDFVEGRVPFFLLSLIIRIVEAIGDASFLTAGFAIIATTFPDNIATTFASLETFFGLGLIAGPTIGAFLYDLGGFTTPFAILGGTLLLAAVFTLFILPESKPVHDKKRTSSVYQILKVPSVFVSGVSILATSLSIGFVQTTLEPHLRQFHISSIAVGVVFVISGGTYAISAPFIGWFCDRGVKPKFISLAGTVCIAVGFCLIGPLPFLIPEPNIWMTITGLFLHGLGISSQLVPGFIDALRGCFANGFANNVETYGLASGMWTSSFALGAFVGPTISGVLYDLVGFRYSLAFVVVLHIFMFFFVLMYILKYTLEPDYKVINDMKSNGGSSLLDSIRGVTSKNIPNSRTNLRTGSISIDQTVPAGVNVLACNSYKADAFSRRESIAGGSIEDGESEIKYRNNGNYGSTVDDTRI